MQNEINNIEDKRKNNTNAKVEDKKITKSNKFNSNSFVTKLKSVKHIEIIIALVVIAVMVLAYTYFVGSKDKDVSTAGETGVSINDELQDILKAIKGVGDVKVLIMYNGGKKLEIASKTDKHTNKVEDDGRITETITEVISPIIVGGDKPLIIGEKRADIDGVVVVAEGGSDSKIRLQIIQAMTVLLKINFNSIQVFEMK